MSPSTRVLGTEPEVGYYKFRATKGAPWQPCRIMKDSGLWIVIATGEVVAGSGVEDPFDIPFLLHRWPLFPVNETEYDALLRAHENAPPGHPLRSPKDKVDLRAAAPLYRGKDR